MWKRWKRLNFCESGSTLKKEAGSGSNLGSLYGAGSGSKKYSTASTSLIVTAILTYHSWICWTTVKEILRILIARIRHAKNINW